MQIADNNLIKLLKEAKTNQDSILEIIKQFHPLLTSLARKNGWKVETEDMESMLTIKLIETVRSMDVPEDVGACVHYISSRMKFSFLDLVKKLNKVSDSEVSTEFMEQAHEYDASDIGFESLIESLDSRKQEILHLKFKEMFTDQEIAIKLGISRQAVNKHLRQAYKELVPSL